MRYRTLPSNAPAAGAAIWHYIHENGLQTRVANAIGMPVWDFNRRLRGQSTSVRPLDADLVRRIALALKVSREEEARWLDLLNSSSEAA